MCLTPLTIRNPYYKAGFCEKATGYGSQFTFTAGEYNKLHNTRDLYIQVPCGNCSQCISMRQSWINQRIQMESLRSHLFMLTLTYKDSELMHTNIGEYMIAYPYYRDFQMMVKNMRTDGYSFRYYAISEYSRKMRPHYHAIIAIEKSDNPDNWPAESRKLEFEYGKLFLKYWRRNYGDRFNPIYSPLCDYVVGRDGRSTFDFHYIRPIQGHDNDCSFYVSKYLYKYNETLQKLLQKIQLDPSLSDAETKQLTHSLKPRSCMSKDFGSWKLESTQNHINTCLTHYRDLPQFSDINTGQTFLLAPYYRKHLLPLSYRQSQYDRLSVAKNINSFNLSDDTLLTEYNITSATTDEKILQQKNIKYLLNKKY